MAMQQIVSMKNVGDETFRHEYELDFYVIEPGETVVMPIGALNCWFGDPYLTNGTKDQWRHKELERVRGRYGCYTSEQEYLLPRFECFDATTGDRVLTVLEDPEGLGGVVDHDIRGGAPGSVIDRIEALTRELDALRATAVSENHGLGSTPETLDVPVPAPEAPAPKRTRKAQAAVDPDAPPIAPPNVSVPKSAPKDSPSRIGIS